MERKRCKRPLAAVLTALALFLGTRFLPLLPGRRAVRYIPVPSIPAMPTR